MRITRRLFVVPLADDHHGKSNINYSIVAQGLGRARTKIQKGKHALTSPWGRKIDALVYVRSYQEAEKHSHKSVVAALDALDENWRLVELILLPSHVTGIGVSIDIDEMIAAAHSAGFDIVAASVLLGGSASENGQAYSEIVMKNWDERWTIPNPRVNDPVGQLDALGRDLWTWICGALTRQ